MSKGFGKPKETYLTITEKIVRCLKTRPKCFREYMASAIQSKEPILAAPYFKRLYFEVGLDAMWANKIIGKSEETKRYFSTKIVEELREEFETLD